jgi:hypothetical protein
MGAPASETGMRITGNQSQQKPRHWRLIVCACLVVSACFSVDRAAGQNCAVDPQCAPSWSKADPIAVELQLGWQPIGRAIEQSGNLVFPQVASGPGVYRFELWHPPDYRAIYIGESQSPGPTQRTNRRIRARMLLVLRASGEVAISLMSDAPGICAQAKCRAARLNSAAERKLLERAGIYEATNKPGVELLNLDLPQPPMTRL